jgi:hypothetical protein
MKTTKKCEAGGCKNDAVAQVLKVEGKEKLSGVGPPTPALAARHGLRESDVYL